MKDGRRVFKHSTLEVFLFLFRGWIESTKLNEKGYKHGILLIDLEGQVVTCALADED